MSIRIEWLDEDKTLLYGLALGKISHAEILGANQQIRALLESAAHPVDIIFDPRKQLYFAPTYLKTLREVQAFKYPNLRLLVFVGNTIAWEFFQIFVHQSAGLSYQVANAPTVEQAREMIESMRARGTLGVPAPKHRWN